MTDEKLTINRPLPFLGTYIEFIETNIGTNTINIYYRYHNIATITRPRVPIGHLEINNHTKVNCILLTEELPASVFRQNSL